MSFESVCSYFTQNGLGDRIHVFEESCATSLEAAENLGVDLAQIAKTLTFKTHDDPCILLVISGDMRIDNKRFKEQFGVRPQMLKPQEVEDAIGQRVGGVCPFTLDRKVPVYLDVSLRRNNSVYPSSGSEDSMIELTLAEIELHSGSNSWVDVGKPS